MALYYSGIDCELREVALKNKPQAMLAASAKGTVPVMILGDRIIDESLQIMDWALATADPLHWGREQLNHSLVVENDGAFKCNLDRYKYSDRYPEQPQQFYFEQAENYLRCLEENMCADSQKNYYLLSSKLSAIDIAIFPFVRQFAFVNKPAFDDLALPMLQQWLSNHLKSRLFEAVMQKYNIWVPGQPGELFAAPS